MSDGETSNKVKYKFPSFSICMVVVLLLMFVVLMISIIIARIQSVTNPLNDNMINESAISSMYVDLEIVEKDQYHTIYVDNQTGILYMEIKSNGYSSALTVLLKEDGTPKKLSDY